MPVLRNVLHVEQEADVVDFRMLLTRQLHQLLVAGMNLFVVVDVGFAGCKAKSGDSQPLLLLLSLSTSVGVCCQCSLVFVVVCRERTLIRNDHCTRLSFLTFKSNRTRSTQSQLDQSPNCTCMQIKMKVGCILFSLPLVLGPHVIDACKSSHPGECIHMVKKDFI